MGIIIFIIIFVVISVITIYYLVAGMLESIFIKRHRIEKDRLVNTNLIVLRVLAGVCALFLLYFFISAIASLFGL
jgi:hypothetical protein